MLSIAAPLPICRFKTSDFLATNKITSNLHTSTVFTPIRDSRLGFPRCHLLFSSLDSMVHPSNNPLTSAPDPPCLCCGKSHPRLNSPLFLLHAWTWAECGKRKTHGHAYWPHVRFLATHLKWAFSISSHLSRWLLTPSHSSGSSQHSLSIDEPDSYFTEKTGAFRRMCSLFHLHLCT